MAQSSLLPAVTVPSDPLLLNAWAERIRGRIGHISRCILKLEEERQSLLSMLWEGGFHEFELQESDGRAETSTPDIPVCIDPPFVQAKRPDASIPCMAMHENLESEKSVIDLVSECSDECGDESGIPPTAELDSLPCVAESADVAFPPTPVLNDEAASEQAYIHDESVPISEPQLLDQSDRVYRPWEGQSAIAWDRMDLPELKQWMQFFGMKPSGGKAFMISQLKLMFSYINGSTVEEADPPEKKQMSTEEAFLAYTKLIRDNKILFERIILFENVEVGEVMAALEPLRADKVPLSVKLVKDYLTYTGAQFSNTSENHKFMRRKKRRKRRESFDDGDIAKTKRQLRRSITCP